MTRCRWLAGLIFTGAVVVTARADTPRTNDLPFAQRVWALTDVIGQKHVLSPRRADMLLAGMKALLKAAGRQAPDDLKERVSRIAGVRELTALLNELGPPPTADQQKAREAAFLEGLFAAVPGHPQLLSPEERRVGAQVNDNRYVGTGIQIALADDKKLAEIRLPFPRGPAHRAGAKPGDLIVAVDGVPMEGVPLVKVVEALRGAEGTSVTMTVRQPQEKMTRDLKMVRGVVPFQTIFGYRRRSADDWDFRPEPSLPAAYLRVGTITSSCLHELRQIERVLQADGAKALVLDLRGPAAGELHNTALLADGLLDGGLLWRLRDGKGNVQEVRADRDCLFRGWPVVVLADEPPSQAVTLLAAALQDNKRAVVVGNPPDADARFVSSVITLPENGLLRLFTHTVERAAPAGSGFTLRADHVVPLDGKRDALDAWFRGQEKPEAQTGPAPRDPQLAKALELLRVVLTKS